MAKILIADDEREIVELLSLYLEKDGYEIFKANDGAEALRVLNKNSINVAILDIMMPEIDGYHLTKRIREKWNIPIIMLSAKSEYSDKILGLEFGADDYVTKPFSALEVAARVKAQLRRYYEFNKDEKNELYTEQDRYMDADNLRVDTVTCTVYKKGKEVILTSKEYKILFLLMSSCGRVYTKKQIFEYVWEEPFYGDDNSIMVHISNLREKIEDNSKDPIYIKTIRGLGYKFGIKNN